MAKHPSLEEEAVSGAPKPAAPSVTPHMWLGRYPVVHPDHVQGLETDAAINEFGRRMPRSKAEGRAHERYVRGQRVGAAAHHLAGMKAAHAAGDMEAASKHSVMYNLHSGALGHEPVGPAHPDVIREMENPQRVYKFKAHKGDLYALDGGKGEQGVEKSDALHRVWAALEPLVKGDVVKFPGNPKPAEDKGKEADVESIRRASLDRGRPFPLPPKTKKAESDLNTWAKAELSARKKSKVVPCRCGAYSHPHRAGGGRCGAGK